MKKENGGIDNVGIVNNILYNKCRQEQKIVEYTYKMNLQMIEDYKIWLAEEEKSKNTIKKYIRDILAFYRFANGGVNEEKVISKTQVMEYKEYLEKKYAVSSVNSMLVAINRFLEYRGWNNCRVRLIKCQRCIFRDEQRELTKDEYRRLVDAARKEKNYRLAMIMETICATGIRVSELEFITVEAAQKGRADINCKGKHRVILLPDKLRKALVRYALEKNICSGYIFRTKTGKPLDRSNIWHDMKGLCKIAGVEPTKVFPHNLRHLFARIFYELEKNIVHLADILGHSSIDTTRVYTISTGTEHVPEINRMGLVV